MNQSKLLWGVCLTLAGSVIAPTQVFSASLLEEVIVTATKREESLQDIGISGTAFNGEQIKDMRLTGMGDIAEFAPNIEFKRFWGAKGNASIFFIRGVGQADFNDGSESPSTVYADEFYLISSSATDFLMHDVSSAELLRGPQGTLFGRNSTAGAVSIRNNRPEHEFDANIKVGFGNYNEREVDGMLNIPLIDDKLAFRLAFNIDKFDPVTENLYDGPGPGAEDIHEGDFTSLRGLLRWDVSEALSLDYKFQYGDVDAVTQGDNSQPLVQVDGETILAETDAFGYNEDIFGASGADKVISDGKNGLENRIRHHLLTANYEINDEWSFTSITGYFDQYKETFEECDGTPRSLCQILQFADQEYLTQEFRLSYDTENARYTFGLYYLDLDFENNWLTTLASGAGTNGTDQPGGLLLTNPNESEMRSYAAYANVAYDLNEKMTLTIGARYNDEQRDFHQKQALFTHDAPDTGTYTLGDDTFGILSLDNAGYADLFENHITGLADESDPEVDYTDTYTDTFANYQLQLDYRLAEGTLVYASFKQGVKAGGFNNGLVDYNVNDLEAIPFDAEENSAYELGMKWTSQTLPLRLNGAVFYYDYKDYQATSFSTTNTGIGVQVLNADATVAGAEAELTFSPMDSIEVALFAGYLDTEIDDITNVGNGVAVTRDRELGHAPKWQGGGMIRHDWQLTNSASINSQLSFRWIDERFVDVLNDPGTELESYGTADFNTTFHPSADSRWSLTAWVKNTADKRAESQQFNFAGLAGTGQINYISPRTFGLEFNYNFGEY